MSPIVFQRIFRFAVAEMEKSFDPSHDALHLHRVVQNCRLLSRHHSCNERVLLAAALLHDIVNIPKNHPERAQASRLAAERAGAFLAQNDFSLEEVSHVQAVIREHSFSAGLKPTSRESEILQDADRLDALGAVGVMRTVTCGTKMGSRYYSEQEPVPVMRALDDRAHTVDHFYVKLFRLAEMMNTEFGKKEAERRVSFMKTFLFQLETEVGSVEIP
ncbi:MAG: HD domain-containing protein [Bdellovibrionales bacterium]|nr:HD domain-containing protein [Bdellovibrionales bacterium]